MKKERRFAVLAYCRKVNEMDRQHHPKISVIIAVYNIEKYLQRCMNSVLEQSFQDQEIILVDDGSTDNCSAICDRYSEIDSRVKVIHQHNQGLSAARNAGTQIATGEWITYVDGDDYVHPLFLERLYSCAVKTNADVIICCSKRIKNEDIATFSSLPRLRKKSFNGETALKTMLYQKKFDVSAWGKLYHRSEGITPLFPHGRVYEDIVPVTQIVANAKQVCWINSPLYYYFQRPNSIMRTANEKNIKDEIEMTNKMYEMVRQNYFFAEPAALSKLFSNYCQVLRSYASCPNPNQQIKAQVVHTLQKNAFKILCDYHVRWKNRCAALLILWNPQWIALLFH